ncbi:restriction endonuclease subunit S [Aquipuribacter sp. MA13-6]|uniref:restriction endonuclease subunit S n=1 Tax=unclassified Aquipuribacter TaxID=2635084 RepID=UPI003EEE04F5
MTFPQMMLKQLGTVTLGKMIQPEPRTAADVAAPYLRAAHVQPDGRLVDLEPKEMWFAQEEMRRLDLRAEDVVVVEGGAGYGRSAVVRRPLPGWGFQNSIVRFRPSPHRTSGRFLDYALQSALGRGEIEAACFTATIPHFTADKVAALRVPAPPLPRQVVVADYLDRETARIDTLIEEQQRLIQLLNERRGALISNAALGSTNQRTVLRRVADVVDCAHVTAPFVEDDNRYPVASIGECQGAVVDLSNSKFTTHEFFDHLRAAGRRPRVGDLLFVRNVSVGLVSAVAPGTPEFALGQETVLIRRKVDVDGQFLRYALMAAEVRHEIEAAMIGSTFRRINVSAIRSLPIPLPTLDQQHAIVSHLDEQILRIDLLAVEAERLIKLSRERRDALITAAVTGQIDVRGKAA